MRIPGVLKIPLLYQLRGLLFARRGLKFTQDWKRQPEQSSRSSNPLEEYFDELKTGPGIFKWRHYFDIYHRHFQKFIGQEAAILEVGVYSGGSLPMWRKYFGEKAAIYGVDIEPACKAYENDHIRVFIGDQASREFWQQFKSEVPMLNIVIDDGGHHPEQQIVTLEEILPHLRPGGVYICEDVHGENNPFHSYVCGLASRLNAFNTKDGLICEALPFQSAISIHLYPFMAVIEKLDSPHNQFTSEKHGTQWQPFLRS